MPNRIRLFLTGAVIALPIIAVLILVQQVNNTSLLAFRPYWSDEVSYWHQVATMLRAGLNGGYYTYAEIPAPIGISHFGTHGLVFPLVVGAFGRIFGWHYASMPILNLLVIVVALVIYVRVVKPNLAQLGVMGLTLLTFFAMLLYLPTNYQESIHHAIAIGLAALVYFHLTHGGDLRPAFVLAIFLVSLLRVPWVFVAVPLILFSPRITPMRLIGRFVLAGLLVGVAFLIFWLFSSPYYESFMGVVINRLSQSVTLAIASVRAQVDKNISLIETGSQVAIVQRYVVFVLIPLFAAASLRPIANLPPVRWLFGPEPIRPAEMGFYVFNLGLALLNNVLFYEFTDWRDFRLMAPHLLLTIFCLIAFRRLRLVVILALISLPLYPTFVEDYRRSSVNNFPPDNADIQPFQDAIAPYLVYDAALDPWCNTVLFGAWPMETLALPPGIGLTLSYLPKQNPPISRYIWLTQKKYEESKDMLNVRHLLTTPSKDGVQRDLYLNLDADCPPLPG